MVGSGASIHFRWQIFIILWDTCDLGYSRGDTSSGGLYMNILENRDQLRKLGEVCEVECSSGALNQGREALA